MTEVLAGVLILLGGGFAAIAALGLLRLPDVLIRMHAATKVGTLGAGLTLGAVALTTGEPQVVLRVLAIIVFLLLTAPIGAHMLGRAALRLGVPLFRTIDTRGEAEGLRADHEARGER